MGEPAARLEPPKPFGERVKDFFNVLTPYFWPEKTKDRIRAFSCFLCLGLSKVSNIVAPLFIGTAVDALSEDPSDITVPVTAIVFFAFFRMMNSVLAELQNYIYLGVKQTAYEEVAVRTFKHLHRLSIGWYLRKKTGAVMRSMDRGIMSANTVVNFLFLRLGPSIVELIVLVAIWISRFNATIPAIILFSGFFAYFVATLTISEWRRKTRAQMVRQDNAANQVAMDSLNNFDLVKQFTNEVFETDRYQQAVRRYQVSMYKTQTSLSLLNGLQQVIVGVTLGAILVVSAHDVANGKYTVGRFVQLQTYTIQTFAPLSFLGTIYSAVINAFTDLENLLTILRQEPDVVDEDGAPPLQLPEGSMRPEAWVDFYTAGETGGAGGEGEEELSRLVDDGKDDDGGAAEDAGEALAAAEAGAGATRGPRGVRIEFCNVSFSYPTPAEETDDGVAEDGNGGVSGSARRRTVLRNVSFVVEPNTTTALVGATGSGKSTIARLLFRFYDPQQGRILIHGQDIQRVQQRSLRSAIGMVPQEGTLFNDTLEFNLRYGRPSASRREIEEAAEMAQVTEFVDRLQDGFETLVGERGMKLSGGERQRVAIARVLLKDPPILVLDEATSALDSITESQIQRALSAATGGRTTLVIAHRLSTIRDADQIIVLHHGKVAECGTHDQLMERENGLYWRMWTRQAEAVEEGRGLDEALDDLFDDDEENGNGSDDDDDALGAIAAAAGAVANGAISRSDHVSLEVDSSERHR